MDHLAVHLVHALAGDVALEVVATVDDGQPVGLGTLEGAHDLGHGRRVAQGGGRIGHELRGGEVVVEFGAEHDVADFDDVDFAQQQAGSIGDGQHTVARARYLMDYLAQLHVGGDGLIVAVDDGVEAHERQHGMVGMVGDKLALASQPESVDAVGFEDVDGQVAGHGDNHERHEEIVAAGNLGYEENARQRGMHDARHDTRHAQQREVLLRDVDTHLVHVPQPRKEEPREAADEERGGKRAATAAAAVGGAGGEDLGEQHEGDVQNQVFGMAIEQGTAQHLVPVGLSLAVEQQVDAVVALAVERREEEDERAEQQAANEEADVGAVLEAGKHVLAGIHGADEVEADQSARHAQEDAGRHAVHGPVAVKMEAEEHGIARKDVGEARGGDTRHEDGQERGHGEVNHQHLEREDESGNGGLEDAGDGSGGTAADEGHERLVVQTEHLAQVGADGRAGEHDGSLGTHGTAKADGDGRSNDAGPHVVGLQPRAVRRDGIEDARDAVRDIVLDNVAHEERGQVDTDDGIDQVEPVVGVSLEVTRQQCHDLVDESMEHEGRHRRQQTYQERQDKQKHLVAHVLHAPLVQPLYPRHGIHF